MDWTASAFGLLVTIVGGLFTLVVVLVRRELDRNLSQVLGLEHRVRTLENGYAVLKPVTNVLERNMEERASQMTEGTA